MKVIQRFTAAALGAATMALLITGCTDEAAEECRASGGTWVQEYTHSKLVFTGKRAVMLPQYEYVCQK